MLLLTDHRRDAVGTEPGERLLGVLEHVRPLRRRGRRHRGRQVDQPARVDGEAAHDLERRRGVLLAHGDGAGEPRLDDALAGDVLDVEQEGGPLLFLGREERLDRLVVHALRGDGHELALGPAQGGEPAAERAAGVDVDRVVQPLGLGDRRVAVDDRRRAAVVGGPLAAHGQPELVRLAGGLAEEREVAHATGGPALVALLHPAVRDDEPTVVEHDVAHEAFEEVARGRAELVGLAGELVERSRRGRA